MNKLICIFGAFLFYNTACCSKEIEKTGYEAIITRYVSVLNAITSPDAPPEDEVKREVFLSLMINFYYIKDQQDDISGKFKGISTSIGRKLNGYDFALEIEKYSNLIKSIDNESAVSRLMLDGFDETVASKIIEKAKRDDFRDILEWVSNK